MNRLEGTHLATGRRRDVNRLQRSRALGLAEPRQRPELDRTQRAVINHCHHSHLSSVVKGALAATFTLHEDKCTIPEKV